MFSLQPTSTRFMPGGSLRLPAQETCPSRVWTPRSHVDLSNLPASSIISDTLGRKVISMQPGILVKAGGAEYAEEVRAHKFAYSCGLPVPRIIHHPPFRPSRTADFNTGIGKFSVWYYCMERLPGVSLHSVIDTMTHDELTSVAHQLRAILARMSAIQPPAKTLGSVDGRPFSNYYFPYHTATRHAFENVGEFNDYWLNVLMSFHSEERAKHIVSHLPRNSRVCLVHTDLYPRNIMVDGTRITGIIDWAQAGFYPDYWEYACMHNPGESMPGWDALLKLVFPGKRRDSEIQAVFDLRCALESFLLF